MDKVVIKAIELLELLAENDRPLGITTITECSELGKNNVHRLLWGFPHFSSSGEAIYYNLTPRDEEVLSRLRTPRSKAHFILQLGYCRAR